MTGKKGNKNSALGGRVKRYVFWLLGIVVAFCLYLVVPETSLSEQGVAALMNRSVTDSLVQVLGLLLDLLLGLVVLTAPLWLARMIFKPKKKDEQTH